MGGEGAGWEGEGAGWEGDAASKAALLGTLEGPLQKSKPIDVARPAPRLWERPTQPVSRDCLRDSLVSVSPCRICVCACARGWGRGAIGAGVRAGGGAARQGRQGPRPLPARPALPCPHTACRSLDWTPPDALPALRHTVCHRGCTRMRARARDEHRSRDMGHMQAHRQHGSPPAWLTASMAHRQHGSPPAWLTSSLCVAHGVVSW